MLFQNIWRQSSAGTGTRTHELSVLWTGMNGVYDRKGEFPLRNVLTQTLVVGVLCIL